MNLYKKCTSKTYSFLFINTTLPSDNPLEKDLVKRIQKLIVIIDDKIRDEQLQYDSNREAVKILALSSGKFDNCES